MMKKNVMVWGLCLVLLAGICGCEEGAVSDVGHGDVSISSMREQARVENEWLAWRMENLLGKMMAKHDIDMWVVLCREYKMSSMLNL